MESTAKRTKQIIKLQLQVDTHTKKRLIPPVMTTVSKYCLFQFQPQKRCQFNLFNENGRNRCLVVEHTVIPFLPNNPNRGKPNDFKKHMCGSR